METHEYAFEVKLVAAVRVRAIDESTALAAVGEMFSTYQDGKGGYFVDEDLIGLVNDSLAKGHKGKITEFSITTEGRSPIWDTAQLFEVDGKEVP